MHALVLYVFTLVSCICAFVTAEILPILWKLPEQEFPNDDIPEQQTTLLA
jgi:hypothetical protein